MTIVIIIIIKKGPNKNIEIETTHKTTHKLRPRYDGAPGDGRFTDACKY